MEAQEGEKRAVVRGRVGGEEGLPKGDRREESKKKNGRMDPRVERITTRDEVTEKNGAQRQWRKVDGWEKTDIFRKLGFFKGLEQ